MASDSLLNEDELAALRALDTPTVCNALELVCPDRRGFGFSSEPMFCLDPSLPPLVGYAKTLTIRSTEPPEGNPLKTRLEYYRHLVADPQPAIAVIQDLDGDRAGFGSFWRASASASLSSYSCPASRRSFFSASAMVTSSHQS